MEINLPDYGWEAFFADAKSTSKNKHLEHGRVVSVHKSRYEVVTAEGVFSCEILGNVQFQKYSLDIPAVGDWVLLDRYRDTRIIVEILSRKNLIKRQKKHDRFPKAIAANIDTAIIVQAVGEDFSIKRLERILVHVHEAGVTPLVVINKIDLVSDEEKKRIKKTLSELHDDIKIIFTSFVTGAGIPELEQQIKEKETVIFIGSSGVGKSSIINYMLGYELQETQETSEATGKGKHTTTARRLIKMNSGVLVVDTPGTREFGMNEDGDESLKESFLKIEELAQQCRFSNCSHGNEPSCFVQEAIAKNILEQQVLDRYLDLQKENSQTAKQMRQSGKQSSRNRIGEPLRSVRAGKTKKRRK